MKKIIISAVVGISLIAPAYAGVSIPELLKNKKPVPTLHLDKDRKPDYPKDSLDSLANVNNQKSHWVTAPANVKPNKWANKPQWNPHPPPPPNVPDNKQMLPPGMITKDPQDYKRLLNSPYLARPPKYPKNTMPPKLPPRLTAPKVPFWHKVVPDKK